MIGKYVRSRFGDDIGCIERITTLEQLMIEAEEDCGEYDEGDLTYFVCRKDDGNTFHICEYECEIL